MKNLLTLITLLTLSWGCFAQNGVILYTDFNPNLCIATTEQSPNDTLFLDFDRDNVVDLRIALIHRTEPVVRFVPARGWHFRTRYDSTYVIPFTTDTIVPAAPHVWKTSAYGYHMTESYNIKKKFGVRKVVNDSTYLYGWLNFNLIVASPGSNNSQFFICIDNMAYCTSPNYPLRWDQSTMTSIEEDNNNTIVSIRPNPTAGLFTIEGDNLRRAEVFNTLGQRVATVDSQGEQISIDISDLPAGIYMVAITDRDNRKYINKVVKE